MTVLERNIKASDPEQNEIYKCLGCEQANKTEVEKITEIVKKEVLSRRDQLVRIYLHEINLIKAINYRTVSVAAYIVNVSKLQKQGITELDRSIKAILR